MVEESFGMAKSWIQSIALEEENEKEEQELEGEEEEVEEEKGQEEREEEKRHLTVLPGCTSCTKTW